MAVFTGNGSAASPSFTFSSDTDTGFFKDGASIRASVDGNVGYAFNASGAADGGFSINSAVASGSAALFVQKTSVPFTGVTNDGAGSVHVYHGTDNASSFTGAYSIGGGSGTTAGLPRLAFAGRQTGGGNQISGGIFVSPDSGNNTTLTEAVRFWHTGRVQFANSAASYSDADALTNPRFEITYRDGGSGRSGKTFASTFQVTNNVQGSIYANDLYIDSSGFTQASGGSDSWYGLRVRNEVPFFSAANKTAVGGRFEVISNAATSQALQVVGGDLVIGGTLPASPNITLSANGQVSVSNTINATNNYDGLAKKRLYQDGDSTGAGSVTVFGLGVLTGGVYRGGIIKISLATAKRASPGNEDQWAEFFITYRGVSSYSTASITRTAGDTSVTCSYTSSTSSSITFDVGYTRTDSHWVLMEVEIVDRNTPECTAIISSAF